MLFWKRKCRSVSFLRKRIKWSLITNSYLKKIKLREFCIQPNFENSVGYICICVYLIILIVKADNVKTDLVCDSPRSTCTFMCDVRVFFNNIPYINHEFVFIKWFNKRPNECSETEKLNKNLPNIRICWNRRRKCWKFQLRWT